MAREKYSNGNGQRIYEVLGILGRYTNTRSTADVRMNDDDFVIVYMNADEPEYQAKVSKDDIERIETLGFRYREENGYMVFVSQD